LLIVGQFAQRFFQIQAGVKPVFTAACQRGNLRQRLCLQRIKKLFCIGRFVLAPAIFVILNFGGN